MRTIGSISSDLCEMQRLRDYNLAVENKDLKWQRRITAAAEAAAEAAEAAKAAEASAVPVPETPTPIFSSHPALSFPQAQVPSSPSPHVALPMTGPVSAAAPSSIPSSAPFALSLHPSASSRPYPHHHLHHHQHQHHHSHPHPHHLRSPPLAPDFHFASAPFVAPMLLTNPTGAKPPLPANASAASASALMMPSLPSQSYPSHPSSSAPTPLFVSTAPVFGQSAQASAHASAHASAPASASGPVPTTNPTAACKSTSSPAALAAAEPIRPATVPKPTNTNINKNMNPTASAQTLSSSVAPTLAPRPPPPNDPATAAAAAEAISATAAALAASAALPGIPSPMPRAPAPVPAPTAGTASKTSPTTMAKGTGVGTGSGTTTGTMGPGRAPTERRREAVKTGGEEDGEMSSSGSSSGSSSCSMEDAAPLQSSTSTRSGTGFGKAPRDGRRTPSAKRSIGKIRRHRMTKEEEARFNPKDLVDLTGSTAAKSRKMSDQERDIMLHKRRLRNRASAARSRDKQRKTITDLGDEMDDLLEMSQDLLSRCLAAEKNVVELRETNDMLVKENSALKENHEPRKDGMNTVLKRTGSTLRVSMSNEMLDKLDKLIATSAGGGDMSVGNGLMRIASKLQVSLSTDRLSDGSGAGLPCLSGSLPALSRNVSVVERLLDYSNHNDLPDSNNKP